MVKRLFCLLAVLAIAGTAGADLVAYYDFGDVVRGPSTVNLGSAGSAADGVLMNGATIVDLDPDEHGVEYVLNLDYGGGSILQFMDIGGGGSTGWANWNGEAGNKQPMTIAAWIYKDPATWGNWRTIMSQGYEVSWNLSTGTQPNPDDDMIAFSAHRGLASWDPIIGTTGVRDGFWHHVAGVVVDAGLAELYIDGVFQGSKTCWNGVNYSIHDVYVGYDQLKEAQGWDFSWNGMIDEVRIYDEALSEEEIQDLFYQSPWSCPPFLPCCRVCRLFEVNAGGPYQVDPGGTVILGGSAGGYPIRLDWYIGGEYLGDAQTLPISYDTLVCDIGLSPGIYPLRYEVEVIMGFDECICGGYDVTTIEIGPAYPDINDDCKLDLGDYAILASQWLEAPGAPSADIAPPPGGDGIVDIYDLGLLVDDWLWEEP